MFHHNRSLVVRKVVIAALVGGTGGAAAGFWSVGRDRSHVAASGVQTPARIAVVQSSPVPAARPPAAASAPASPPAPASSPAAAAAAPVRRPPAPAAESPNLVERARALARRPDVKALVALRESFLRQIGERGETESAENQRVLNELNRYLAEARLLRLKLDAEEFRNASVEGSRPR